MKRSCQRHTQVFDLPVRRMISLVPTPSALNRTISARQTCLCGLLRSRASAFRRRRSAGLRVMKIPVRMRQTRMHSGPGESPPGFKCQTRSTRLGGGRCEPQAHGARLKAPASATVRTFKKLAFTMYFLNHLGAVGGVAARTGDPVFGGTGRPEGNE